MLRIGTYLLYETFSKVDIARSQHQEGSVSVLMIEIFHSRGVASRHVP